MSEGIEPACPVAPGKIAHLFKKLEQLYPFGDRPPNFLLGRLHLTGRYSRRSFQRREPSRPRQRTLSAKLQGALGATLGLLVLAACAGGGSDFDPEAGAAFTGGAAADEPRAVLIAEAILAGGGSAADAATALYFALTVTYPVAAGLAGGGACIVYDAASDSSESLSFLPGRAAAGGPVAIPGAPRGFAVLHARFGRLRWPEVVLPAEELARFGHPVSRALVRRIEDSRIAGRADAALGNLVAPLGAPIAEATSVEQDALAATLSRIRTRGGGDLYFGGLANDFVRGAAAAGGRVTAEDLRAFRPAWRSSAELRVGGDLVVYAGPAAPGGGRLGAAIWAALADQSRYEDAAAAERPHLLAEASARALASQARGEAPLAVNGAGLLNGYEPDRHISVDLPVDLGAWARPGDDGTTSFVVVDGRGSAVACGLTMNGSFGAGQMIPELGVVLAPPAVDGPAGWPSAGGDFLAPLIIVDESRGGFVFVGAASGGPAGPIALSATAIAVLTGEATLRAAVSRPRLFQFARPDAVFAETALDESTLQSLRDRGHAVRPVAPSGRVNAALCRPGDRIPCQFASESRGFGTATGLGF